MSFKNKIIVIMLGIMVLTTVGGILFTRFISSVVSDNMMGSWLSKVPVFQTGVFTDDGSYFVYTYKPQVVKPNVDANVMIKGGASPTYFQIIETATGKILDSPYESGKFVWLSVVWTEGNLVWLYEDPNKGESSLALYDINARKFRFNFGEIEKLNPSIPGFTRRFFINTTNENGLLVEAADKRYYRIDSETGIAENIKGKFSLLDFNSHRFHVSSHSIHPDYRKVNINGSRESIKHNKSEVVSEDDFIKVNYLTLDRNKKFEDDAPITYYNDHFFVLSPVIDGNEKDKILTAINRTSLKTLWTLSLPQEEGKHFIPNYENERFYINENQMYVTNNDYLLVIDLDRGIIKRSTKLFQ